MSNDRETVIVDRGGGSGAAVIGGIVVVLLLVVGYFVFFNGQSGGSGTVDIDVPAVSVDVAPDGQ